MRDFQFDWGYYESFLSAVVRCSPACTARLASTSPAARLPVEARRQLASGETWPCESRIARHEISRSDRPTEARRQHARQSRVEACPSSTFGVDDTRCIAAQRRSAAVRHRDA